MIGPEKRAKIRSPEGPLSFITPKTSTENSEISSPTTTVLAIPFMPVRTSETGINSTASTDHVIMQQKKIASKHFVCRRNTSNNMLFLPLFTLNNSNFLPLRDRCATFYCHSRYRSVYRRSCCRYGTG